MTNEEAILELNRMRHTLELKANRLRQPSIAVHTTQADRLQRIALIGRQLSALLHAELVMHGLEPPQRPRGSIRQDIRHQNGLD